jgi:Outer membrane protein beta-barrel domain
MKVSTNAGKKIFIFVCNSSTIMKYKTLFFITTALLVSYISAAQVSIGLKTGPNYIFYLPSKTDIINESKPGWGADAGLVLKLGDNKRISFRAELLYSLQVSKTEIDFTHTTIMPASGYHVTGRFHRHTLMIPAQIQLNMMKNRNLYLAFGPYGQYTMASSGNGTYNYYYIPESSFSGNDPVDSKKIFTPANIGATLAIGIQKIKLGQISFFGELRESVGFIKIYKDDYAKAEWVGCITTLAIGIEFYRSR